MHFQSISKGLKETNLYVCLDIQTTVWMCLMFFSPHM